MFYSQVDRGSLRIETVSCGAGCFQIQFHIPKRNIKSHSTYPNNTTEMIPLSIDPRSSHIGLASPIAPKITLLQKFQNYFYQCLHCLWISRVSIQLNQIPCLLYLLIFLFGILFYILEYSNPNSYYNLAYANYNDDASSNTMTNVNNNNNNSKKNNNDKSLSFNPNDANFASMSELQTKLESTYPNSIVLSTPLSRSDLGVLSWTFLHTMAANYPENANDQRQQDLLQFWQSFSRLYPCGECAKHMRTNLENEKESLMKSVKSEKEYSVWLCQFHNIVNKQLNKPNMDCNYDTLHTKWKSDEYCGCDNEEIEGVDQQSTNSQLNGNNNVNNPKRLMIMNGYNRDNQNSNHQIRNPPQFDIGKQLAGT